MLKNLIEDLKKQTYQNFSVIIVDDASTDATKHITPKILQRQFSILHSKKNLQMVKARNKGLALAKQADYYMIFDDDNRIDKDFLEEINMFLNLYKNFGIIGFKSYYQDRKTLLTCGCNYNLSIMFPHFLRNEFYSDYTSVTAVTNCFLIKKEVLKRLQQFDEKYMIDFSETEFCLRAKKQGFQTVSANISLYHQSEKRDFYGELMRRAQTRPETYFYTFRNKYLIVSEFGSFINKILFFGIFQFVTLLGYLYALAKLKKTKYFILYLRAFFAGNFYLLTGIPLPYEKT